MSQPKLEDALKRLSEIVKQLEQNDVALEDALKLFEEGVQLTRSCHATLTEAEKKIEILTRVSAQGVETKPFGAP
jgi:exodeoxyribonuclease VII small subunit